MTPELKRQLISAAKTFIGAFLVVLGTSIQTLDLEALTSGLVVGLLMAAARTAVKLAWEAFLPEA